MMKPIRISLVALILFFVVQSLVYAQDGVFLTRYYCQDLDGHKRWEATAKIVPLEKGKNIYLLTEEGKGVYSGFSGPVSWKTEVEFFSDKERISPIEVKIEFFSFRGKAIFQETQKFDTAKGTVSCEKNDLVKGKQYRNVFKYRGDIVNKFLLGLYVQRLLERGHKEKNTFFISSEPSMYQINIKVMGEEDVGINGETKKAYKIYLDPIVGLMSPVKLVLPKNYVWHLNKPDFAWLKYGGVESTITSPKVEIITLEK